MFVIVFLKGREGYTNPGVLHPKGRDGVRYDSPVEFRSDDFTYSEIDEFIKGIDMLLGKSL